MKNRWKTLLMYFLCTLLFVGLSCVVLIFVLKDGVYVKESVGLEYDEWTYKIVTFLAVETLVIWFLASLFILFGKHTYPIWWITFIFDIAIPIIIAFALVFIIYPLDDCWGTSFAVVGLFTVSAIAPFLLTTKLLQNMFHLNPMEIY